MDDLKRQLDAVDSSPTVQAVLVLAGFYVRYLVWKGMGKLEQHRARKRARKAEQERRAKGGEAYS